MLKWQQYEVGAKVFRTASMHRYSYPLPTVDICQGAIMTFSGNNQRGLGDFDKASGFDNVNTASTDCIILLVFPSH